MSTFPLKPTHKPVKAYFEALATFTKHGHTTEGNTRSAFADLLKRCCPTYGWHLVEEYQFKGTNKKPLRADGALVDDLTLVHGLWEAKDADDDLTKEIKRKRDAGYPLTNILFQSPGHAVLYQGDRIAFNDPITTPEKLVEVLKLFFEHKQSHEVDWEEAVNKFAEKIPELATGVTGILEGEFKQNATFRENFQSFAELCRQSINPDLIDDAIRKMLVQHLLTERIFRKVFNNQEFLQRNVIAAEIEKVIKSITARHFSRDAFLKPLDRFYTAIEKAAESQEGYTEKQHFLNAVYEKFFQRFDTKQADTHGIVYTPQPIVDFMVRSVEEILHQEFGKSLSDSGVHILDPFTGTGNFITRIMQQIKRSALPHKYAEELHCNEIMLLPYYIASMNIEHAYMERAGEYKPFEGICLVDTFDLAEPKQADLFTTENTERVRRQKRSPVFVAIGNPPYNAWQSDESKENKNRRYKTLHKRVWESYAAESKATLLNSLSDPYVCAYRWASDRIGREGIVAFVSNSGFLDGFAMDGMRKSLSAEFDDIYLVDLRGNVRQDPKLSGTTHNVFGIQVGVVVSVLVRRAHERPRTAAIHYTRMDQYWRRTRKLDYLSSASINGTPWQVLQQNERGDWLTADLASDYAQLLPLGANKRDGAKGANSVFQVFSSGVKTNRDTWVINFSDSELVKNVETASDFYNDEVRRLSKLPSATRSKAALYYDDSKISWSDDLKESARRGISVSAEPEQFRPILYRPFVRAWLFFSRTFNNRVYLLPSLLPTRESELANRLICVEAPACSKPFHVLSSQVIPDLHLVGDSQCFPFYSYDSETGSRRENITDWALNEFRNHYAETAITKWDIFHATYAILHHPEYRTRYAANLKRELPRIPFPPDFHAFAQAGKRLMELHIDYEKQPEYPLRQIESETAEVSFRVTRMKVSKDKTELKYNDFLTLRGIPLDVYNYRLGNRSALEWIVDQYRVTTDSRSGITNDPNREDDPQYILRLIGQVITVSLETNEIVANLPSLGLEEPQSKA